MDPLQIHAALKEIRSLHTAIVDKQRFRGYSGRARALGGCVALAAGVSLQGLAIQVPEQVLAAWGVVFACAVGLNYGTAFYWLLRKAHPHHRGIPQLPETLSIWLAGGALTAALWLHGQADLLYGMWMLLFGVAQIVTRRSLPRGIGWTGCWYLCAGLTCLALPQGLFTWHPLAMGLVFFAGEFAGGLIFHTEGDWRRLRAFFGLAPAPMENAR